MSRFGIAGRMSVALAATVGAALVLAAGPAQAAVGDIIERPVPTTDRGGLDRITTGPDGNIWFTNRGANQIGRLTPAGEFTGFTIPTASSRPSDITTGPDGALWFTERVGNIGRITTSGQITEFPVSRTAGGPANISGITNGPDRALWFTTDCCDPANPGKIGRITTSGAISLYPAGLGTTPTVGITTGPDGNLWYPVTNSAGFGLIQRMSPSGQVISGDFVIPTKFSDPSRLVTGPDGNVWFTEQGAVQNNPSPGKIGRVTTSGQVTEFQTPDQNPPSNPAGIAVGPDGNLWYTEYSYQNPDGTQHGGNRVGRITTAGAITEFPIPTQYARADGITGGPDGGVYFTESPNNSALRAVGRIQALGDPVPAPLPVPPAPAPPVPVQASPLVTAKLTTTLTLKARSRPRSGGSTARKYAVSGRVRIPAGASKAKVCTGRVTLTLKQGSKTVASGTAKLTNTCSYAKVISVSPKRLAGRKGKLTLRARFGGNALLKASRRSATL